MIWSARPVWGRVGVDMVDGNDGEECWEEEREGWREEQGKALEVEECGGGGPAAEHVEAGAPVEFFGDREEGIAM